MNKLQKIGFSSLAFVTMIERGMAINFGGDKVSADLKGDNTTADVAVQSLINKAMGFLGILAVLYAIYGGFMILTAAWDDGKVKKGKTILFQALLGLLVIFLAYSIVSWLISSIFGGTKS
ncbi:MAG: hypothetical protein ACD_2C00088G0017 [uncultured bacterium (gcode 4)]|uniref:Uncharacterized protein n=1 Tax=uncultured bacterium (gcode 4) TaxID=1234023 RepID=K2G6A9_9BACT|nr:MAG: hypothetical protein ACD_2C00088G0017 [uncultured bacterium (gcode 4)]